ncbi:hypothetical protein BDZ89DRAFT_1136323 [Hymenopellis radicata]|nr:hypothetical protein BDZ89DRAFT_1136323 [Hymenopellis radicata]
MPPRPRIALLIIETYTMPGRRGHLSRPQSHQVVLHSCSAVGDSSSRATEAKAQFWEGCACRHHWITTRGAPDVVRLSSIDSGFSLLCMYPCFASWLNHDFSLYSSRGLTTRSDEFCLAGEATLAAFIQAASVQDFFIRDALMSARRLRLYHLVWSSCSPLRVQWTTNPDVIDHNESCQAVHIVMIVLTRSIIFDLRPRTRVLQTHLVIAAFSIHDAFDVRAKIAPFTHSNWSEPARPLVVFSFLRPQWSQFSRKFCLAGEATRAALIHAASVREGFLAIPLISAPGSLTFPIFPEILPGRRGHTGCSHSRRVRSGCFDLKSDQNLRLSPGKFCLAGEATPAALLHGFEHSVFFYAQTVVCVVRPDKCVAPPNRTSASLIPLDYRHFG